MERFNVLNKRSINLTFFLLWTITLSGFSFYALSQKVFTVGVEDVNYAPHYAFGYESSVARDILEDFAKKNDIKFIYRPTTIPQLYRRLLSLETIDFKYPDHPSWAQDIKRDTPIAYSKGMVEYVDGIMVLPETNIKYVNQLKVVGALNGFTIVPYLDLIPKHNINVLRANNFENLIQALVKGRVDGIYANIDVVRAKTKEYYGEDKQVVFNYKLPYQRSDYRLSTKKHGNIISKFDSYLAENQEFIKGLMRRYNIQDIEYVK